MHWPPMEAAMKRTTLSLACQRCGFCAREKPDLSGLAGKFRQSIGGRSRSLEGTPAGRFHGRKEILIARSRERYAKPRTVGEDRIRRWMEQGI